MYKLKEKADEYQALIDEIFDKLHSIPEKGLKEYKTSAYLKEKMEEAGCFHEIIQVGETGLIGVIHGREPGPVIGIRADFDALEFEIDGEKVCKHACGHDAHATMALVAAIIAGKEGLKKGTLKLVLQPAEEILAGARLIIDSGHIDDVDEMYGGHLRPIQEAKFGEATAGLWHSASKMVKVKVQGKEAHGARPHLGINSIDAGVCIVNAVNSIHLNPASNYSVKCTEFRAGGLATNIVPADCSLAFDLRADTNEGMDELFRKVEAAVVNGAAAVGAKAEIVEAGGVPAATYDPELLEVTREAITDVLGSCLPDIYTPGGEDFHFFATEGGLRTAYFGLGADLKPGLHSIDMEFDPRALTVGVKIWLNIIENRLMR